jgi:L-lysine 6-transaminase
VITAVRGRGLMIAFDLPSRALRDEFYRGLFDLGLLALRCGERSIRFRPALDLPESAIGEAMEILEKQCRRTSNPLV